MKECQKLLSVCDFQGGSQPPKSEWEKNPKEGYVRMLQIRDFTQSRNADIEYVKLSSRLRLCKNDDILIGRYGASLGKILSGLTGAYNVALMKVVPNIDVIISLFLKYYLLSPSFQDRLKQIGGRAAQAGFNKEDLKDLEIPVPPLPEQQRIVDYLDSAFAKIDQLKANAEKQLEDAKALFSAALEEAMRPKEGWEEKSLEEIVDAGTSISYGIVQPGDDIENGVPIIRPVDLTTKIITDTRNLKRTKPSISVNYKRTILNGRELLMCVRGNTGVMSMTSDVVKNCNVTRGIVPLKVANDVTRLFVYYCLIAPVASNFIQMHTKGAALKQINISDVKRVPVYMPSLSDQQFIVSHLDTLSSKVNQLQENYKTIIKECDALKQALLREVFE